MQNKAGWASDKRQVGRSGGLRRQWQVEAEDDVMTRERLFEVAAAARCEGKALRWRFGTGRVEAMRMLMLMLMGSRGARTLSWFGDGISQHSGGGGGGGG